MLPKLEGIGPLSSLSERNLEENISEDRRKKLNPCHVLLLNRQNRVGQALTERSDWPSSPRKME